MNARRAEPLTIWIPRSVLRSCTDDAAATFPLETGGTFMGWWADPVTAVVNGMIGAGPNASRSAFHFEPDQDWQVEQIARYYEACGRRETYLGDWHSHPRARTGSISRTDRNVLRRIIKTPSARCLAPLMAIFYGDTASWQLKVWRARCVRPFLWERLVVDEMALSIAE